jgi:hypothetical protein
MAEVINNIADSAIDRVSEVILSALPGADPHLARLPNGGAVSGFVLWEGFDELDQVDRQQKLWGAIRSGLSEEEQDSVSAIFTLTPMEFELTNDEDDGD